MKKWLLTFMLAISSNGFSAERIVSIGGDVSEIVFALGEGQRVVARDSTSLNPKEIRSLPDVGYMRMLNSEGILSMHPSLVLASELAQPSLALKQVEDSGVKVIKVTSEISLEAVPEKIMTVAKAVNQEKRGDALAAQYQQQLADINTSNIPINIIYVMSHGGITPMAAGQHTAADKIIHAIGAKNAMQGFQGYRPLSQEGVIASKPDLLLISTEGVKTLGGMEKIWQLPGLKFTPAGQKKQVVVVDEMGLLGFGLQTPAVMKQVREAAERVQ
ncbi:heme/hemin ABC transporter substrate-binding protein [Xenorhabdus szentirmaii]|nr:MULTISPECIES: hemin ABC transporter substrate-binding protein [Xenorhabdus]MBD2779725.1 hemin ABC transporter substrate-binding protein [Xenorhabdus sp. 38]MBD2793400.1 hemin ABC transporter substrate-binding protein [Xenorhabdus sp. CUL]MBD2802683.1 hemin ABC transporter substrate-binding protein [Xenorhabdus sp. M]MBD2804562.1 hemin ABC transporter substrate-binding protein [Xenorhabdus sp. ZM]MBD2819592.1 hemin ABC transporter substrate-binding protein [Xenorhabdus sp. 42]